MTDQPPPPPGNYPPPQQPGGGYPPPPGGGYPPPPPPGGGYPPPPPPGGGYPPPPPPPGGAPGYGAPQGGYGAPQGGGYPAAQGGYGPPGGGYPPPGGSQGLNVGEAFSWAWAKFTKNAAALIVPMLVYAVVIGILYAIVVGLIVATAPDTVTTYDSYGSGFDYSASSSIGAIGVIVLILAAIVAVLLLAAIQSAYIGGALDIANGQPVTVGSFFKPRNIGSVIIATLIISVLSAIGQLVIIGGIVVGFFTVFAIVAIVDRNLSPIDGLKTSFETVKNNIGPALITWLMVAVIVAVGALLCGVGLIVAIPVAMLFLVYSWRRLTGGPVSAADLNPQPLPPGPQPQQ